MTQSGIIIKSVCFAAALACALLFCIPGSMASEGAAAPEEVHGQVSYVLGSEDALKITVFGEDDISGNYRIGPGGGISMPLIGEIILQGQTLAGAENLIEEKLADGYLVSPSVSVEVMEHRPFYILGEVKAPGSYDYVSNMNVLSAVASAGGFTYRANRKKAKILRGGNTAEGEYQTIPVESPVAPGDIIVVQERFF